LIRYVKQKDKSSCGPVAILNVLKWAGGDHVTYKSLPYIRKVCETDEGGTDSGNFSVVLLRAGAERFSTRWILQPDHETVFSHLANGGAIVILHAYPKKWGAHYSFFVGEFGQRVIAINHFDEETSKTVEAKYLKKLLKSGKQGDMLYPEVWLLTKE
jgi:hypothetical protein